MVAKGKDWVPARQEVIWIDCNPQAGREMRDLHPFLVLSPGNFNAKTSLVIGLPMTTAEYNADNPFAVAVGKAKAKPDKISYVLCHQPKSFDWRVRNATPTRCGNWTKRALAKCAPFSNKSCNWALVRPRPTAPRPSGVARDSAWPVRHLTYCRLLAISATLEGQARTL